MSEMQEIEVSIELAKKEVGLRDALLRLKDNADFRKVFLEGYIKDESLRLVLLKSAPNITDQINSNIDRDLYAISSFSAYMDWQITKGDQMEESLKEAEDTREEILAEELNS